VVELISDYPFVERCLNEFMEKQGLGGSWGSEDGRESAVNANVEALRIPKHVV